MGDRIRVPPTQMTMFCASVSTGEAEFDGQTFLALVCKGPAHTEVQLLCPMDMAESLAQAIYNAHTEATSKLTVPKKKLHIPDTEMPNGKEPTSSA